jgi:translation initiation factor 1
MSKKKSAQSGIVYSTNPDFNYLNPQQSSGDTKTNQQDLRVWLEYHGGKAVTIVRNFIGNTDSLEKLGKELKIKCGVGGTVKDGDIIIQGNQREKVMKLLLEKGYKAKKAGG